MTRKKPTISTASVVREYIDTQPSMRPKPVHRLSWVRARTHICQVASSLASANGASS